MKNLPSFYAILPAHVRYDKSIKANAKVLYAEITNLINDKGYCCSTNSDFADLYEVSKETISRWINDLVKKGYLRSVLVFEKDKKNILERRLYISQNPQA